jgi:hypothetical protein
VTAGVDDRLAVELPPAVEREDRELLEAMTTLSAFILRRAHELRAKLGFGWVPAVDAPDTYPDLLQAFRRSQQTGQPLPVSSQHNESVIYVSLHVNSAMRFYHDVRHVQTGLTFDLVDELELAQVQLGELAAAGYPPSSLVWQLLHADLAGQAYLLAVSGQFPVDQRGFALDCVRQGLDRAVITTARRQRAS